MSAVDPHITPTNAESAEALGWTVDRSCYPWSAYVGPRFDPDRVVAIDTPAYHFEEPGIVAQIFALIDKAETLDLMEAAITTPVTEVEAVLRAALALKHHKTTEFYRSVNG